MLSTVSKYFTRCLKKFSKDSGSPSFLSPFPLPLPASRPSLLPFFSLSSFLPPPIFCFSPSLPSFISCLTLLPFLPCLLPSFPPFLPPSLPSCLLPSLPDTYPHQSPIGQLHQPLFLPFSDWIAGAEDESRWTLPCFKDGNSEAQRVNGSHPRSYMSRTSWHQVTDI